MSRIQRDQLLLLLSLVVHLKVNFVMEWWLQPLFEQRNRRIVGGNDAELCEVCRVQGRIARSAVFAADKSSMS